MGWLANLLAGVQGGEERYTHLDLLEDGLKVVETAIRNLSSEMIFELREQISTIVRTN